MIEKIEKLEAHTQQAIFSMRDLGVFHDREVRVEVARSMKTIAPLRKGHARAAARTFRTWKISCVESSLLTCR
jgi:hypothetical protein